MNKETNRNNAARKWALRLALVLYDVAAVNLAYYLALVIRFYVNHEFHLAGSIFMPIFLKFAPWYTVCCILVFAAFRLYSGMWKYAGLNDMNRVLKASAVTCLIQILGTLLFLRRMPITYYAIGAAIQFVLICISRFSYRIFSAERSKLAREKNADAVNVMIIGAGETAKMLLRQLENDSESAAHPVCVVDCRGGEAGRLFDGLPVLGGLESIRDAAGKYKVRSAVIADALISQEERKAVRETCRELGIGVQDYSGFTHGAPRGISLKQLMACVNGPVEIVLDGSAQRFENGEQAANSLTGKYLVKSISPRQDCLSVEIVSDLAVLNNVNETWVKDYESETGEAISFF